MAIKSVQFVLKFGHVESMFLIIQASALSSEFNKDSFFLCDLAVIVILAEK